MGDSAFAKSQRDSCDCVDEDKIVARYADQARAIYTRAKADDVDSRVDKFASLAKEKYHRKEWSLLLDLFNKYPAGIVREYQNDEL